MDFPRFIRHFGQKSKTRFNLVIRISMLDRPLGGLTWYFDLNKGKHISLKADVSFWNFGL